MKDRTKIWRNQKSVANEASLDSEGKTTKITKYPRIPTPGNQT